MSDNTSSTPQSYLDQARGFVQSGLGKVTGDSSLEAQGDIEKAKGEAKNEASHETAKIGPFSADPNTGAVAKDNENRPTGQWDQTLGSTKEAVGNLIGNENLRRGGAEQNAAGKEQEAKGQLTDFGKGIQNRAMGALGSVGAAVTGDREGEQEYRDMHDEGKVRQRGAEADIVKKQGE